MNIRISSITLALLLIVNSVVLAETTTQYIMDGNESDNVVLYLEKDVVNDDTEIEFPNAEVLSASYTVSGGADQDGSYPEDLSITISGNKWEYSGEGYGALGNQKTFSNGAPSSAAVFSDEAGGETTVEMYLPVNATITNAEVTLKGLTKGNGDLDDYRLVSDNTNEGSHSLSPSILRDGNDQYIVWADNGDLNDKDLYYSILFNSGGNSGWDEPVRLTPQDSTYIYDDPLIVGDSDFLLAGWLYSGILQYTYSTNGGDSWSTIDDFDYDYYIYYYDFALDESGTFHLVWSAYTDDGSESDYRVFHSYSEDNGVTWSSENEVSDSSVASSNMYPTVSFDDDDVFVTWIGATTSNAGAFFAVSDDGGDSFGTPSQINTSGDAVSVDVSSDSNSNVIISWTERGDETSAVVKARSSSNSGSTFNTELTLTGAEDVTIDSYLHSGNDGSGNYYVTWTRQDSSDYYDIMVARSANSGNTWSSGVEIDGIDEDSQRVYSSISVDSTGLVVSWIDLYDGDGASSDPDIYFSKSTNDGSSWSTPKEVGSEQYYEGDSSAVSLSYSGDYLYAIYVDSGDADPDGDSNGNDALNDDGDIFFKRSSDDGVSWSDSIVISSGIYDGRSYETFDYSSYYYSYYAPAVASYGNYVYVIWSDYSFDDAQYQIKFSSSSNSGSTWSDPVIISSLSSDVNSYGPAIVADGSNIYVAWQSVQSSGTIVYDIMTRISEDNGDTWSELSAVTSGDGTNYIPEVAYGNDRFHVTWHTYAKDGSSDADYTVEYAYTEDSGVSWERVTLRDGAGSGDFCWFPNIDIDGNYIYIVWQDDGDYDGDGAFDFDVVTIYSEDGGDTWNDPFLIVDSDPYSNAYTLPAVASKNGYVYVSYQEYNGSQYEHRFLLSQNYGETWSDTFPINEGHIVNYAKMDIVIDDKTYFAYYDDADLFSEEDIDYDIILRTTSDEGYPTNPTINLDNGGYDWEWTGEFNPDNSPIIWDSNGENGALKSFKGALEDGIEYAIDNDETYVDDYGIEMANLIFTITSDSDGRIGLSDLNIEYDLELTVQSNDLKEKLNTLVDPDSNEDTVGTKISVLSSTNGKVILSNLEIITAEADLEITQMMFSDENPKEGSSVVVTAYVKNSGQGEASVDLTFWYDSDKEIGSSSVSGIGSGETKSVSITWTDLPAGSHEVTVSIVNSVPVDSNQGDEDTASQTINIQEANPVIVSSFDFDEIPVENTDVDWALNIENEGEKYGNIIIYIYENEEDEDNLIYESPNTRIDPGVSREFTGNWAVDKNVELFFLKIVDTDTDEIVNGDGDGEEIEISIQKVPYFTIGKVEWLNAPDGDVVTTFSDGTIAYAKIYIRNEGTFDVSATVELSLTKAGKKLTPSPSYGADIAFPGDSETILMISGEYPQVYFNLGENEVLEGVWTLEIEITDINAVNNNEQIWDSEELIFKNTDSKIEVLQPPNLALIKFTTSDETIKEGQAVVLTIDIANEGQAEAIGKIQIKQGTTVLGNVDFIAPGYETTEITYEYSVPGEYDGELNLKVQIDSNSVYPPGGTVSKDFLTLKLTVEGTLNVKPADTSSGAGNMVVPVAALGILLAGFGGVYFMYRRTQSNDEESDAFGMPDQTIPPEIPPAAAPLQPVAPPPAAAPLQPVAPPPAAAPPPQPVAPPPAEAPPQTPPVAPPQSVLTVTVPAGTQPGQQIQIRAPDGRVIAVNIPPGMQPGSQFQVKV